MPKWLRFTLIGLLVVLIGIQLVPVARTNPPVETEIPAPDNVKQVLKESCYDCHSNETKWPWYSYVAPVSWLVADDVKNGRKRVNFSTWNQYNERQQAKKIEGIWDEVQQGEMPLANYLTQHPNARLTQEDKNTLHSWVESATPESSPVPEDDGSAVPEGTESGPN